MNIINLKNDITEMQEINILAQWYVGNNFRINNFFIVNDVTYKLKPTNDMGFTTFAYSEPIENSILYDKLKLNRKQITIFIEKL